MNNHNSQTKIENNVNSNPCIDNLTDLEYLEHMIPHHQVAIDMSVLLQKHTSSDIMSKMKAYKDTLFTDDKWIKEIINTKLDTYNPILSKAKEGECNPLFFKPNDHSQHMKGMKLTDRSYLEHMIPHHQVAIDMSRRLLLHTNNSYLLEFCRKLILSQQSEILYMNNLLMNIDFLYKSELLQN